MRVAVLLATAFLLAGCVGVHVHTGSSGSGIRTVTRTVTVERTPQAPKFGALSQTQNARYFGTPISITKADATRYLLVLKPQFFLVGVTANVVAAEQQQIACAPLVCPGALDDRVAIPAGSQKLTFVLPAATKGTVITVGHQQMHNTTVTAAQLAAIVGGAKTPKLIEPLDSGLWLTVDVDKITSFVQQFQP